MSNSVEQSLPHVGFGSLEWFRSVFNLRLDYQRAVEILSQGCGALPVLKNLEEQTTTLLTEFAVGKEALTIQPPTDYTITVTNDHKCHVFASSFTEYGEQLEGYVHFDKMPAMIGKGLQQAFSTLTTLEPGEGMVIFSPTEFYQQYESTSDVINPILVTDIVRDAAGNTTEVHARGWFLFPNKKLSTSERSLWLECHQQETVFSDEVNPTNLVMNPHFLPTAIGQPNADPDITIKSYISWINRNFADQTGNPLFLKDVDQEDEVKHTLRGKVQHHLETLYDKLINFREIEFYQQLWQWIKEGQRAWAEDIAHIDFDWYWNQLAYGVIQIGGFHPADYGTETDIFSSKTDVQPHHHCKYHGEYEGRHCPKCKNKE